MEKAINVLKKEIENCDNMIKYVENQLDSHNHITADGLRIMELKSYLADLNDIKGSCLKAIDKLQ